MTYNKESIEKIQDMSELRKTIDQLDSDIIALFKLRFQCMDSAARIKSEKSAVRDETRKAEVLTNVKQLASDAGIPVPTMAAIWEMLIETSISYEFEKWDQMRDS